MADSKELITTEIRADMPYTVAEKAPDVQKRFKKLLQYRRQARIAQADNRTDMAIDEDFYDSIQMTPEDIAVLADRGQVPEVYNIIKHIANSVIGAERMMRWDYNILPRKKNGAPSAKSKSKYFKYIMDVCKGEYERSQAFTEAYCAGLGWLEVGARNTDEILFVRHEKWRNMWYDHLHSRPDGSDMRWVNRERWVDLDIIQAMFEQHSEMLEALAENTSSLYPYKPDEVGVSDNASEFDMEDLDFLSGGSYDYVRQRLRLIEMQYRIPAHIQIMKMRDEDTPYGALDGAPFRSNHPDHQYLVKGGYFTTENAYRMIVRHAMWVGKLLLQDVMTPYNHNRFSFIPIFCYRRKRDNMPYGAIRDLRDPQTAYNAKKMRARFLMAAKQIVIEKGATNDMVKFHREMRRADGIAEVEDGKIEKWKELTHENLIAEHINAAKDDERFMYSIGNVTADAEWQSRKDLSGKAMNIQENKSQQGQGVIFDNHMLSFTSVGEIVLANMEQFVDKEKEFRITGDQQKDEFVTVNNKKEDGSVDMDNSITAQKADFIIGKRDFRESIRQAQLEQFLKLITDLGKIDPKIVLSLLDLIVDMMDDLEHKDEAVTRIRKINGQHAPEDEMTDEEKANTKKQEQEMQQDQAMQKQMQQALMQLKVAGEKVKVEASMSKALKDKADAMFKKVETFITALETAGMLSQNQHLAEAADALIAEAEAQPGGEDKGQEQQQAQPQQAQNPIKED